MILENKKKRKLSENNKSNNKSTDNINMKENSFKIGKCYIADSNYVPNKEDEIAISVNDYINIIEVLDNDRAYGKNEKTNQNGIFPLSCLKNKVIKTQNEEIGTNKSLIQCLGLSLCLLIVFPIVMYIIIAIAFSVAWKGD